MNDDIAEEYTGHETKPIRESMIRFTVDVEAKQIYIEECPDEDAFKEVVETIYTSLIEQDLIFHDIRDYKIIFVY